MAYQQTTATSLSDVISQIVAFAVANAGFTDEGPITVSSYTGHQISKGGIYWTFADLLSNTGSLGARMSYSVTAGAWPTAANGQAYWTLASTNGFSGPFTNLYLYTDGVAVHAVIELTNGIFTNISFGSITKTDTFTGGEFVTGNYIGTKIGSPSYFTGYADNWNNSPIFTGGYNRIYLYDGISFIRNIKTTGTTGDQNDFAPFGQLLNGQNAQGQCYGAMLDTLILDSPNNATLRTPMFPMYIQIRDPVSALWKSSGYVSGIMVTPIEYIDPAQLILTNWQVFPAFGQKNGSNLVAPQTGNWGLAYLRS